MRNRDVGEMDRVVMLWPAIDRSKLLVLDKDYLRLDIERLER